MKKLLLVAAVLFSSACFAQNAAVTKDGNFVAVSKVKVEPVKTGKTFTTSDKQVYPVYQTASGKFFVIRKSKTTGNEYRQYLKVN